MGKQKNIKNIQKKHNPLIISAKIIMLILTLVYSACMVIMAGAGLVYNREVYGSDLNRIGIMLIISGIMMTFGAILCLFRKNIPNIISAVLSVFGYIICMIMLSRLVNHADRSGWSDKYTMLPISNMYKTRLIPVIFPVLISVAVAVAQLLSYEAQEERRIRKNKKISEENAPAPSIIDSDE